MNFKTLCALAFIFLLCTGIAFAAVAVYDDGTYEGEATSINFEDNSVTFDGSKATVAASPLSTTLETDAGSYKYAYMPICYSDKADEFIIGGSIATDITASGVSGVMQSTSAEGYITLDAETDYLLWYMALPETFYDGGLAADLVLSFDMSESAGASGTDSYDLNIYEIGNESSALSSQNLSMSATARAWVDSAGFGDDASISGANKVLVVKLNTEASGDDCNVYGARLKYRPGIDFD